MDMVESRSDSSIFGSNSIVRDRARQLMEVASVATNIEDRNSCFKSLKQRTDKEMESWKLRQVGKTIVLSAIAGAIASACTSQDLSRLLNSQAYHRQVSEDLLKRYGVAMELQSCEMLQDNLEGSCSFKATAEQIKKLADQLDLQPLQINSELSPASNQMLRLQELKQTKCWVNIQMQPSQHVSSFAVYDDSKHTKKQLWGGDKTALGKGVALNSIELLYADTDRVGCFWLKYAYGY